MSFSFSFGHLFPFLIAQSLFSNGSVSVSQVNATTPPTVYPAYHGYPIATRELAATLSVPLIDLDKMCTALLESVGPTYSTNFMYNHYQPGEWPNYLNGNSDDVHFQEMGAIEMAKLIVKGIRNLSSDTNVSKLIPYLTPTYKVTFTSNNSAAGLITRTEYFPAGITVTAYAWPNSGYNFTGWTGAITSTKRNTTFVMGTAAKTINATFQSTATATVYQAETGTVSSGGVLNESTNTGFTGTGYANTANASSAYWEITVNVATVGTYSLDFRFANGGTVDRPADLSINGAVVQSAVSFPATSAWTTWSDVVISKALNAGNNTIRLTATTANGCANLDKLTIQ